MRIYKQFCAEQFDESGRLTDIQFHYPDNFNFGYDVVDAIAQKSPASGPWSGVISEGGERVFNFGGSAFCAPYGVPVSGPVGYSPHALPASRPCG